MAQQQLNNLDSAQVFRTKLNSNFTDLYTNKAIINHSSENTEFGIGSTNMFGHVKVTAQNGLSILNGIISMSQGTTSSPGALQLVNNYTTNDETKAVTAAALKNVKDSAVETYNGTTVPSSSLGKVGDIYVKTS